MLMISVATLGMFKGAMEPRFYFRERGGERGEMTVQLKPGESFQSLLKRFRKEVTKSRILSDYRKKRWYISKSEQRRRQRKKAIRKAKRKLWRRQRRNRQRR